MSEPVQVESAKVDRTPTNLWGYRTEMGKRNEAESISITLGGDEKLSVWAEINFAGSGQEKVFDKNLQLLMRYADAGHEKKPWTDDKTETWGSFTFVGSKTVDKNIVNETKKGDALDRVSIWPHEFLDLNFEPVYVIQGAGSPDGERKIYICGQGKDKKIDDVMEDVTEILVNAKNGLKGNPSISLAERQELGLI